MLVREILPRSLEDLRIGLPINASLKKLEKMQGPLEENGPINREIFLFAYSEEIQMLYKKLEDCLPDL